MGDRKSAKLARTMYRSLLRWGRLNSDVPFTLRSVDVQAVVPTLNYVNLSPEGGSAVMAISRWAFRTSSCLQGPSAAAALDRGLEALRMLNTGYASLLDTMRRSRAERADRTGVAHRVGQVFVHRKFGYKFVVYGWDRRCERPDEWARQMNANPAQPYYYCLPDEADCQRQFGGVRLTKYVGEDNMVQVEGVRVVNRAIDSYFQGYSDAQGRYIPTGRLQYEYPDDYSTGSEALRPAAQDANLLLHAEEAAEDPGTAGAAAPPAPSGSPQGSGGRSMTECGATP